MKDLLDKYGESEIPVKEVLEKLMRDKVKADKSRLPGICSIDWEFNLSSIFVEIDTPLVKINMFDLPLNHSMRTLRLIIIN